MKNGPPRLCVIDIYIFGERVSEITLIMNLSPGFPV